MEHRHHARFVFNIGLEQRSMWRPDKHVRGPLSAQRITTSSQMRELAVSRGELSWLRAGSSSVQQAALRDLDRAYGNFWAGRANYPRFKRRDDRAGGFVIRDLAVRRLNRTRAEVMVPKIGYVRFRLSRPWTDVQAATSARVTQQNGRWHVSFTTPAAAKIRAGTGAVAGIDRGVKNTLAISDGQMIQAPSFTEGEQQRFVRLQQQLARQTHAARKGGRRLRDCRRRNLTLDRLAAFGRRLADRRADWVEQTSTALARSYDLIAVEDLRVQNMVRRPKPKPERIGRAGSRTTVLVRKPA